MSHLIFVVVIALKNRIKMKVTLVFKHSSQFNRSPSPDKWIIYSSPLFILIDWNSSERLPSPVLFTSPLFILDHRRSSFFFKSNFVPSEAFKSYKCRIALGLDGYCVSKVFGVRHMAMNGLWAVTNDQAKLKT